MHLRRVLVVVLDRVTTMDIATVDYSSVFASLDTLVSTAKATFAMGSRVVRTVIVSPSTWEASWLHPLAPVCAMQAGQVPLVTKTRAQARLARVTASV